MTGHGGRVPWLCVSEQVGAWALWDCTCMLTVRLRFLAPAGGDRGGRLAKQCEAVGNGKLVARTS